MLEDGERKARQALDTSNIETELTDEDITVTPKKRNHKRPMRFDHSDSDEQTDSDGSKKSPGKKKKISRVSIPPTVENRQQSQVMKPQQQSSSGKNSQQIQVIEPQQQSSSSKNSQQSKVMEPQQQSSSGKNSQQSQVMEPQQNTRMFVLHCNYISAS